MKKLGLILLFATLISTYSFGQKDAIATFFSQYMEDDRFTSVFVNPKLFKMISKVAPEDMDPDVKHLIANLDGLRILSLEDGDGMSLYREAKSKINTKGYEELMSVRKGNGEEVLFLVKESEDMISELLMISGSRDEFNMISFMGDINLNVISRLSKDLDIDGMEHFREVEDKRN